ncbi:MAG TPA: type II toxin-antitoxin system VapC family toxin [Solirubrobacteraceae bacterium]|nr:type II toxin-antitoxin system VapC family toxin [Solirubrobacteraceae bacterium]
MSVVLDAWAIVALLKGERAGPRVRTVMADEDAVMSSINLGEAYYILARDFEESRVHDTVHELRRQVRVLDPDFELVLCAAGIKARRPVSYADAFCVATGMRHGAGVWTGDPEIIALADLVEVVDLR